MRKLWICLITAAIALVGSSVALANANGVGKTPLNAALGFNVHANLKGHLTYVADPRGPNAGFRAMCKGYTSDTGGFVEGGAFVTVTATCTDQDGNTVFLDATFVDRGEPGNQDEVCLEWSTTSGGTPFITDCGTIRSGNVQVRPPRPAGSPTSARMESAKW